MKHEVIKKGKIVETTFTDDQRPWVHPIPKEAYAPGRYKIVKQAEIGAIKMARRYGPLLGHKEAGKPSGMKIRSTSSGLYLIPKDINKESEDERE